MQTRQVLDTPDALYHSKGILQMDSAKYTAKTDMKECSVCHETKAKSRFFTEDVDSICRRCQIGLLYENMQKALADEFRGRASHGYIYVFHSALMGLYKIGRSVNPIERRNALCIPDIELVFTFYSKHMAIHETLLHHIYKPQRFGLEWFTLNDEHIAEIKVIGSKLGMVIDSPENFDWKGLVGEQEKNERARINKIREIEGAEEIARTEAWKKYKAQFRRRCPNCLRLFKIKNEHKFCKRECRDQYRNSKRIQNAYLFDPDNIVIAIAEARDQIHQYDYDESEIGVQNYRAATKRLRELEQAQAALDELADQAYHLMMD